MKPKSIQGYAIALSYLGEYQKECGINKELREIDFLLMNIVRTRCQKKARQDKTSPKKVLISVVEEAYDSFVGFIEDKDKRIICLIFVFHLILKNPESRKHKRLTELALELSKPFFFKEEEDIQLAKNYVNRFYGIGNATKKA